MLYDQSAATAMKQTRAEMRRALTTFIRGQRQSTPAKDADAKTALPRARRQTEPRRSAEVARQVT